MNTISLQDVAVVCRAASAEARRIRRRLGLPPAEHADIAQDLTVDLLKRLRHFDPDRASLEVFAGLVVRQHGRRLCAQATRRLTAQGGSHVHLDARDADGRPLQERIGNECGLWTASNRNALTEVEIHVSVRAALGTLDADDRAFCNALMAHPAILLVEQGWGSRSAIYRRMAALRADFLARGAGPDLLAA